MAKSRTAQLDPKLFAPASDGQPGISLTAVAERRGKHGGPRLVEPTPTPAEAEPAPERPPVTEVRRFNTTRLLPAKYSESVLTRVAESDEDLQKLFELESVTNERLIAEAGLRLGVTTRELVFHLPHARIINAAFTHPHPQGGRFSLPYRGAWYAAFELPTAKSEVQFHRNLQFTEIGWSSVEELDYDQYLADFAGSFHDLRSYTAEPPPSPRPPRAVHTIELHAAGSRRPTSFAERMAACLDPHSYIHSQQLTIELLEERSAGVLYPSTRKRGGQCLACFRPALVTNVRKRDRYRLTWFPDRPPQWTRMPPPA